jgi:hypothetical protein
MTKIAIVGASESKWTEAEKELVKTMIWAELRDQIQKDDDTLNIEEYDTVKNTTFISGGCPKGGVDIWAEEIADIFAIPKQIFKPEVERWDDMWNDTNDVKFIGYKSRNIQIAEACDILYCLSPGRVEDIEEPVFGSGRFKRPLTEVWNGGIWTLHYMKQHFPNKKAVSIIVKVH